VSDIDDLAEARAKLRDKGGAWRAQLLLSATKDPRPLLANALLALHEAPEWGGVLGYDEFALTAMALRPPPWVRTNGEWPQRAWSDRDDTLTAEWLQRQGIGVTERVAAVAVQAVAQEHSYHPVRDYLTGLRGWCQPARDFAPPISALRIPLPCCRGALPVRGRCAHHAAGV
jgi:hypothetical protein